MIHTVLQVFGLVLALCGAWLVAGTGGVMVLAGLVLALVSVAIETGRREPAQVSDLSGGE